MENESQGSMDEYEFQGLLDDLAAMHSQGKGMAKALTATDADTDADAKIQAAADDGGDQDGTADADADAADDDQDANYFGKSFGVTLADGTQAEAVDGTKVVKSLFAANRELTRKNAEMAKAITATGGVLKQYSDVIKLQSEMLTQQSEMLKSLQADVRRLAGQGSGRKAVVTMHEKPAHSAMGGGGNGASIGGRQEVLAKALSFQREGKLNTTDVARIEGSLNQYGKVPPEYARLFLDA